MIAILLLAAWMLFFASLIWVFVDAGKRDLSDSFFHSRWSWLLGTFVLWLAFFPLYLADRSGSFVREERYEPEPPGESLVDLWDGVELADMDRITRRALKHARRAA
jgi:heme/copper-type cytochrome/quinol oxidase subunit 1